MKKLYLTKRYLIFLVLLVFILNPLWANQPSGDGNKNPIATIHGDSNGVFWAIHQHIQYESIKLTLSPAFEEEVFVMETNLQPSTDPLVDGSYNYELVVTPLLNSSVRGQLTAARKAADGQEAAGAVRYLKRQGNIPQQRQVQSGHFMILDGQLISPDEEE